MVPCGRPRRKRPKDTIGFERCPVPVELMVNELLTAAQARAARAWLNWSKQELADRSGISEKTITRFELGHSVPYASTLAKMRSAFEDAGICFQFEGASAKGIRVP